MYHVCTFIYTYIYTCDFIYTCMQHTLWGVTYSVKTLTTQTPLFHNAAMYIISQCSNVCMHKFIFTHQAHTHTLSVSRVDTHVTAGRSWKTPGASDLMPFEVSDRTPPADGHAPATRDSSKEFSSSWKSQLPVVMVLYAWMLETHTNRRNVRIMYISGAAGSARCVCRSAQFSSPAQR